MAKTTIHSDYIPDNAITSTKIAENSIGAREIATNAITTLYVADGSVTTVKIADDAITSAKLGSALTLGGNTTFSGETLSMSHTGNTSTISLTQKAGTQNSVATISANREDTSSSASRLLFSTNDGTSTLQRMRINNGGDISFYEDTGTTAKFFWDASAESLGIGTSSPNTTLTLSDGTDEFDFGVTTNQLLIKSVTSDGSDDQRIIIDAGNGGLSSTRGAYIALSGNEASTEPGHAIYQMGNVSGSSHVFRKAGGLDAVTIDSSGNVAIGTTPEVWASTFTGFQVSSSVLYNNNDNDTYLGANFFYDGSNKYINSSHATAYGQQDGEHVWWTAPSGTAGNAVTFTERMRIDSSGFVHIGTTDANHKGLSIKYHAANDSYTPSNFNDFSLLRLNVANAEGNYAGITYTHNGGTEFFTGLVRVGATSDITDYVFQGYNGNSNTYQEYMRINSTGQVLANSLGVTTPTFAFSNDTNTGMTRPTGDTLQLITAGAQRLRINANGRIGIGTNGGNSGLHVANGDIRCTAAAIANDANSISMSQESAGGVITARGPSTSTRGKIYLSVNKSNGGDALAGFLLDNNGRIGMGDPSYTNQSSPNYQVHICGDGTSLAIESGTGNAQIGSQNTSYFHFLGNRNFYFGNASYASGGFHTYSDERLKENIIKIDSALDKVSQMKGVTFNWKDKELRGDGKQFGIIAQDMLKVDKELPNLTEHAEATQEEIEDENIETQYYSMDYSRITPFLIEAVKELKTKLEAAEARITELEG